MKNNKTAFNTIAYMISYASTLAISLILTPYLVNTFGAEAYSFYSIANSMTAYAMIICNALNIIACRYIVIQIKREQYSLANDYYKTVFVANLVIILVLIVPMILCVAFLDNIIDIPEILVNDVKVLFAFIFASVVINVFASLYSIATVAKNRMDLRAYRETSGALLKLFLFIAIFYLFKPNIFYVGIVTFLVAVFHAFVQMIYTRYLLPNISIKEGALHFKYIKELLIESFWTTLNNLGNNLLAGLTIVIINILYGASEASYVSIVHTPIGLLNGVISALVVALYPKLLGSFTNHHDSWEKMTNSLQKVVAVFSNTTVAGIALLGIEFYKLWVPSVDSSYLQIVTLIQILSIFIIGNIQLYTNVNVITLHQKFPALFLLLTSLLNIFGMVFVKQILHLSMLWAILFNVFITAIYYLVFLPIYSCKTNNWKLRTVYCSILKSGIAVLLCLVIGKVINNNLLFDETWVHLIIKILIFGSLFLIINTVVVLDDQVVTFIKKRRR